MNTTVVSHSLFTAVLQGKYYFPSHFTDRENEAQKGSGIARGHTAKTWPVNPAVCPQSVLWESRVVSPRSPLSVNVSSWDSMKGCDILCPVLQGPVHLRAQRNGGRRDGVGEPTGIKIGGFGKESLRVWTFFKHPGHSGTSAGTRSCSQRKKCLSVCLSDGLESCGTLFAVRGLTLHVCGEQPNRTRKGLGENATSVGVSHFHQQASELIRMTCS